MRSLPLHLSCTRDPSRQDCGGTRTRGNLLLPCCCDLASTTAGSVLVPRRTVAEAAAGARCLQDEQAAPDARILPPTLRARAADSMLEAVNRDQDQREINKERFRDLSQDSANEDRSRHLAGETLLFYDATTYGSEVIPKSFSTCKIHTNIVNKVSKSQNFTSFKNIKI